MSEEIQKFLHLVDLAIQNGQATVGCPGPGSARKLRRRFYRMREAISGPGRFMADAVKFRLNGAQVIVEKRTDWSENVSTPNAGSSENPPVDTKTPP